MKKYNIINNCLGWLCFVIAAVTYILTVEPTASFWDCPEFITQGFKLEVGHPPGNPIFMLTARFFVTMFGGAAQNAALAVNIMSALLSAGTILLLFWTVTHLIKKLLVADDAQSVSPFRMILIMAGGLCGALAYTWSDTFWFSAVEGEVYAFSSFCTALVFWLILKWENRAYQPHSDRYLVLIAYVIGISIAVHLLNLLCIPAIVLVFYYKKFKNPDVKGSLMALGVSAVIVFFILYGLVPGFIAVAQRFEIFFVNTCGLGYNMGVLIYVLLTVAVFIWTIAQLYRQKSAAAIKIGVLFSIILSGMPFVGHGALIPTILVIALVVYLWMFCKKVPVRLFNVLILSVFVIFIGYSSYALLLIRASADTPMNQNAPDNVFALSSYLNREQYGDRPLFYGPTVAEELDIITLGQDESGNAIRGVRVDENGYPDVKPVRGVVYDNSAPVDNGRDTYAKIVKSSKGEPDRYVKAVHRPEYEYSPSMNMLLPRIYSPDDKLVRSYKSWAEYTNPDFENIPRDLRLQWAEQGYVLESEIRPYLDNMIEIDQGTIDGQYGAEPYSTMGWKMSAFTNLKYFLNYQLNHMFWRYFMWNFAGRQNDLQGNGEPHLGNWISGIPVIDNARLGDQSALPDEFGKGNKGHNVFYMLPLLLGLIGLLWQALSTRHIDPRRGIEQFWVIFFLFFMTGIAIVLYLNQTPCQPRERDYAFAGSFYAFAIWIGIGIPAIGMMLKDLITKLAKGKETGGARIAAAAVAVIAAIGVPVQMVSQTWDDHDRSGRYTTRDFGMNYLNSLEKDAVIFTNGDNDTFPLWYAQEVEGVRRDVRVVNISYLATDWYANQIRRPAYDAGGVPMYARPYDYAYERFWMQKMADPEDSLSAVPRPAPVALPEFYARTSKTYRNLAQKYVLDDDIKYLTDGFIYAPLDSASTYERFGEYPETVEPQIGPYMNLEVASLPRSAGLGTGLTFDIVANSASNGWKRPVYFATTVPSAYYLGFDKYMYTTGMAKMVTPFADRAVSPVDDKAYENIMSKFRWGGLDQGRDLYLDETVRRMVSSTRLGILEVVSSLINDAEALATKWAREHASAQGRPAPRTKADMARELLVKMDTHLPVSVAPYESMLDLQLAETYASLWSKTGNPADLKRARELADACVERYSQLVKYASTLTPGRRMALGSSERQALNYLTIALGFENYLDLRQAMLKQKADPEALQLLDRTMGINEGYEAYKWIYLYNLTDAELDSIASNDDMGYYGDTPIRAKSLKVLHSDYGVNPSTRSDKAAAKMGLSRRAWENVIH